MNGNRTKTSYKCGLSCLGHECHEPVVALGRAAYSRGACAFGTFAILRRLRRSYFAWKISHLAFGVSVLLCVYNNSRVTELLSLISTGIETKVTTQHTSSTRPR